MCKTVFRNNLQAVIGVPRPVADWLTESATDAEVAALSGPTTPDAADVRATAGAILTRITAAIAA
jgi:hypothetical protein